LLGSLAKRRRWRLTIDEELDLLEDLLRRLKVEYDIFFGGGSRRPPVDLEWRLQSLVKRHGDTQKLSHSQRFRYNAVAQRYAVFGDLWRQKLRIKEEGYRRPQDALLSIQGLRTEDEHAAARALKEGEQSGAPSTDPSTGMTGDSDSSCRLEEKGAPKGHGTIVNRETNVQPFAVAISDPAVEKAKIFELFEALLEARRRSGESCGGSFDSFLAFLSQKTEQIRRESACEMVEFRVELEQNKVRLKGRPRK
jgi:hypothetical protein